MIIKVDNATINQIREFVEVVNKIQPRKVFSILEQKTTAIDYTYPYYEFFSHLNDFPNDRFFKFDDDVVYIRPRSFNYVIDQKNSSKCFMHFFNIAGSNWRCS